MKETQRVIKFRLIYKGKIHGYERLTYGIGNIYWQWMSLGLNPANGGERWSKGVYPAGFEYVRNQFTGLQDSKGVDIYEGDVLKSNHFHDGKMMHFLHHRIIWDHKHTGWMAASSKSTDLTEPGNTQLWVYERNAEDFEVIGHIYDPKFSHLL